MLERELLAKQGVLIAGPEGPLAAEDFAALGARSGCAGVDCRLTSNAPATETGDTIRRKPEQVWKTEI